jgi:hypothetical protein
MRMRCAPPLDLSELYRGTQEREREHKESIDKTSRLRADSDAAGLRHHRTVYEAERAAASRSSPSSFPHATPFRRDYHRYRPSKMHHHPNGAGSHNATASE